MGERLAIFSLYFHNYEYVLLKYSRLTDGSACNMACSNMGRAENALDVARRSLFSPTWGKASV